MTRSAADSWPSLVLAALACIGAITIAAAVTGLWVLTALPIGFLFGFFLERSDLCGSSAFSEVVMMKDSRKVQGLWVAITTSMVLFALAASLGWIKLNPKPLIWANYLVGGVIFGVGIVLAGGCVSGALFKAGQGNLNSMAALVGIPVGVAAVAYGPLQGLNKALKKHLITAADGSSVTLSTVTGLPYWLLALLIAAGTLTVALMLRRRRRNRNQAASNLANLSNGQQPSALQRLLTRPWQPWQSGLAIGVLALLAYFSSAASGRNYPLGVTHGVLDVQVLLTDYPVASVWTKAPSPPLNTSGLGGPAEPAGGGTKASAGGTKPAIGNTKKPAESIAHHRKHVVWWLVGLVVFLVIGSHTSARLRGNFALRPKPPDETIVAFGGGLLTGAGAALAGGCVIGNILSGLALMSIGNLLFAIVVVLANWLTTYLYMMGGPSRSS